MERLGALAALSAAVLWMLNGVVMERKGAGLDSGAINLARLSLGLLLTTLAAALIYGGPLQAGVGLGAWLWLLLSGLVGFSLGDTFLIGGFQLIGARLTLLIFSLSPVLTAALSYVFFGEALSLLNILGMLLVLSGIFLVIGRVDADGSKALGKGLVYALIAALTQAIANITSKMGLLEVNALYATQMRLVGGVAGMLILFLLGRRWGRLLTLLRSPKGRLAVLSGGVVGTLFGVLLSMIALQLTKAAVASTLNATMPVLILPVSHFLLKEKLRPKDLLGALLSVAGSAVLFL
ncbi:MAG: DMT family transporter [Christensenellales bacterium]